MADWLKKNWFIAGLVATVLLAWLFPEPGARGGVLQSEDTTRLGVILIFLFQGLTLSPEAVKTGLMQWRLHIFVQVFIFLVIPLAALVLIFTASPVLSRELSTGFFFLAVLPTTIATSVAYTAMTKGNVAGAVFNSSLANVAGIFITPLWVSLWMQAGGVSMPLGELFLNISKLLLAPFVVGQILRPVVYKQADALKKYFSMTSSLIIIFIVYAAFCNSWEDGIWEQQGLMAVLSAGGGSAFFLALVLGLVAIGVKLFRFERQNAMAALFCAPQKTMAAGVPMANLMFEHHAGLGMILLPLMFYHLLQLLVGGAMVNRINAAGK